jgi:hypothetical protein
MRPWSATFIGPIFVLGLLISGCSRSSDPDCGSSQAKELVSNLVKQVSDNPLLESIVANSEQEANSDKPDPALARQLESLNTELAQHEFACLDACKNAFKCPDAPMKSEDAFCGEGATKYRVAMAPEINRRNNEEIKVVRSLRSKISLARDKVDSSIESNKRSFVEAWDKAQEAVVYTLDLIRTEEINPQTKAVMCKADLKASIKRWGEANTEIAYKLEKTSDNKLYGTIFSFK